MPSRLKLYHRLWRWLLIDLQPDVITLFKDPLMAESENEAELYENIRHTLWHEIAHYFGLGHEQIHRLENGDKD